MTTINNEKPDYMKAAAMVDQIIKMSGDVEAIIPCGELSDMIGWSWSDMVDRLLQLEADLQKAADRAALIDIINRRSEGLQVMRVKTCRGSDGWKEITEVYPATMEIEIGGGGLSPEVIPFSDVLSLMIDI